MKHEAPTLGKFLMLQRKLKLPRWQVVGLLESVWLYAANHAPTGFLRGDRLAELGAWVDAEDDFVEMVLEAMSGTRWLDKKPDGWQIHDWLQHAPDFIRKRVERQSLAPPVQTSPDTSRHVQTSPDKSGNVTYNPTQPNPSIPNPKEHNQTIKPGETPMAKAGVISLSDMDGWMAGRGEGSEPDIRAVLERLGIRGPNLDDLAGSGLTVGRIRSELASIDGDGQVRNSVAVLTRRLKLAAGLNGKKPLDAGSRRVMAQLEQLRRNRGGGNT